MGSPSRPPPQQQRGVRFSVMSEEFTHACTYCCLPTVCLCYRTGQRRPEVPLCLCKGALFDVLHLLPVHVMTYGCDFPHPHTFPLVSGVLESEGHSSITGIPQSLGAIGVCDIYNLLSCYSWSYLCQKFYQKGQSTSPARWADFQERSEETASIFLF